MASWLFNKVLEVIDQIVMARRLEREQRTRNMEALRAFNRIWAEARELAKAAHHG